jgi:predicted membrane protein
VRKASIAPGTEAVIDVFAMWGGIDMKIPEDWTVVNRVSAVMGGVEDKTESTDPSSSKRLVLRGIVLMGGVSLKN